MGPPSTVNSFPTTTITTPHPHYVELSPSPRATSSITVPGSKSFTNRALIISALADECSTLINPSEIADSQALLDGLILLDAISLDSSELNGVKAWKITGKVRAKDPKTAQTDAKPIEIDVGPAGTAMRFLTALCAAWNGCEVILKGSERMHQRPIAELVDALRQMGAEIQYLGVSGCAPLYIKGALLRGYLGAPSSESCHGIKSPISIPGSTSSQFISSLLMIAPLLENGLTLEVTDPIVSGSYLDMTRETMAQFGVRVAYSQQMTSIANKVYTVPPNSRYVATNYQVEADGSGASYLWAIGAVTGQAVRIEGLNLTSSQADIQFPRLLEQMGCSVISGTAPLSQSPAKTLGFIEVCGPSAPLKPIKADLTLMPDCAQTLAVLAAIAPGTSVLTGLKTLKIKETDRLAALSRELLKLGVKSEITADTITIFGRPPSSLSQLSPLPLIDTYDDHRMAMAFSVIGATIPGLRIKDPNVVNKSFPNFWEVINQLGVTARFSADSCAKQESLKLVSKDRGLFTG